MREVVSVSFHIDFIHGPPHAVGEQGDALRAGVSHSFLSLGSTTSSELLGCYCLRDSGNGWLETSYVDIKFLSLGSKSAMKLSALKLSALLRGTSQC